MRLVVAGIGTEVGKTLAAAILTEAVEGVYWKPIQCGAPSDRERVEAWLEGRRRGLSEVHRFEAPLSPHQAAREEGCEIRVAELSPPAAQGPLVIEGTGGILAPLTLNEVWMDAALRWEGVWFLVHRFYLGSLNHCLLTLAFLRQHKIPLTGLILNGRGDPSTEEMLIRKSEAPWVGTIPWRSSWEPEHIQEVALRWKPFLQQLLGL